VKHRFLTVHDYGTGGVWQYIYAESEEAIMRKYPLLEVVHTEPQWLTDGLGTRLQEYDIDAEPDQVLANFTNA
jgi:hypothetical protein